MTNRIDELWGQALDRAVPETYSSLTWTQVERIKAVFAELIVRECIRVPYDMWDKAELNADIAVKIEHRIKDHFGVEV